MTIGGIHFDLHLTLLIILSTIIPMVDHYGHSLFGQTAVRSAKAYDRFFFYMVIPMMLIYFVFRERPSDYGFQLGNWRVGLKWTLLSWLVMSVAPRPCRSSMTSSKSLR